ncbi:MAG: response regulator transcription factor [Thalassobaculum sp.]|uniref:response regulator transcription factor n=1 Tax=Thalassobaculum sp. TaxID=2022740 RepID=UPI0032ECC1B5
MSDAVVLVVDDDPDIRSTVCAILERDGLSVIEAATGTDVDDALSRRALSAVVLDLRLNGEDGMEIAKRIRSRSGVPIVILSANDDVIDKVVCLEIGVDDYVTKPFHAREFSARVRNAIRRNPQQGRNDPPVPPAPSNAITFGDWRYDLEFGTLHSQETGEVILTTYEHKILRAFVEQPRKVFSRDALLDLTAGRDWSPFDRSIDVLVAKLRKKLGDDMKQPRYIKTIRGEGYSWLVNVSTARLDL